MECREKAKRVGIELQYNFIEAQNSIGLWKRYNETVRWIFTVINYKHQNMKNELRFRSCMKRNIEHHGTKQSCTIFSTTWNNKLFTNTINSK